MTSPYRNPPVFTNPRCPSWWERIRCRIGFHTWTPKTRTLKVLDGEVQAPDHLECIVCGKIWVSKDHNPREEDGFCPCNTCKVALEKRFPVLEPYQNLVIYGDLLAPITSPKLIAIREETIRRHPIYLETERRNSHWKTS